MNHSRSVGKCYVRAEVPSRYACLTTCDGHDEESFLGDFNNCILACARIEYFVSITCIM